MGIRIIGRAEDSGPPNRDNDGDGDIHTLYVPDGSWPWSAPGFDCDDFADALAASLNRHLIPLDPAGANHIRALVASPRARRVRPVLPRPARGPS
jgi:hypothetical protein